MQKLKPKSPLQGGKYTIERVMSQLSFIPLLCLMLAFLPVLQVYGQVAGGHVTRETCTVCGRIVQNCPYKGNHPKCTTCGKVKENCPYKGNHPKCTTCGKVKEQCPYKGDHPKCPTCGKVKEQCPYKGDHPKCPTCGKAMEECPYKGNHPAPEAAGYDVTFSCNVPDAALFIDGNQNGTASGTRFLKTGKHSIKLAAQGYEPLTREITVNSDSKSFSFTLTEEKNVIPPVLQQLEQDMVFVEGGTFTMGATAEQKKDAFKNEKPAHEVTLSSFHICRHEVTQAEWEAVMGSNPSYFKGANRPVEQVSWDDCQTFIRKLNQLTGKQYRLPTEAEWEYAARGGQKSQGYKYSGSNTLGSVAWYADNSSETHDVMTKQANELGLYDMNGNVWEWCSDWYGDYRSAPQTSPKGPSSGSGRVLRGGSWLNDAGFCRVPLRFRYAPDCRRSNLGLRLAL